jgi:hypothetical protein
MHVRPVQAEPRLPGDPVGPHSTSPPWRMDSREETPIPCAIEAASVSCSAVAVMYTAWPVPGGTVESNTTMAICGRTAMFREWRAPG